MNNARAMPEIAFCSRRLTTWLETGLLLMSLVAFSVVTVVTQLWLSCDSGPVALWFSFLRKRRKCREPLLGVRQTCHMTEVGNRRTHCCSIVRVTGFFESLEPKSHDISGFATKHNRKFSGSLHELLGWHRLTDNSEIFNFIWAKRVHSIDHSTPAA